MIFSNFLQFIKNNFSKQRVEISILVFYGVFAIVLLSPLASDTILPQATDFANHTGMIVQAKMAIDEGQFPLSVAPWQFDGFRLPLFQFYSPSPYLVAGLIYKWVTPTNPYLAYKLMLWLSLTTAGFFTCKSSFRLTRSLMAAVLSGIVYMTAPYFLINIHARGAFTEAVAQGILPIVLYFSLRSAVSPKLRYILLSAISWFALATTHLITFAFLALFLGILFLSISIKKRIRLVKLSIAGALGCLLGMFYLVPVLTHKYLQIYASVDNHNPFVDRWLTPLATLLSSTSVSPVPGGVETAYLNPSVGWPILLAVGLVCYYLVSNSSSHYAVQTHRLVSSLLCLLFLAIFMTWSPVDFWSYVPKSFWVIQFPYRLLAQIGWVGSLLFAYAIVMMFGRQFNIRTTAIGLMLIQISISSYLPSLQKNSKELSEIIQSPSMGYGESAYLVQADVFPAKFIYANTDLALIYQDNWLMLDRETQVRYHPSMSKPDAVLHIDGTVWPEIGPKVNLIIVINDHKVAQRQLTPGQFIWDIPIKDIVKEENAFRLKFLTDKSFTTQQDPREHAIYVNSLAFQRLASKISVLPVAVSQSNCHQKGQETSCTISVPKDVHFVQIPVLYYPGLLDVRVNDEKVNYLPIPHRQYMLVGIQLKPGTYRISVIYQGVRRARWGSLLAWIATLFFLSISFIPSALRKKIVRGFSQWLEVKQKK